MTPSIKRMLSLSDLLDRKSHFLFGPRQTGKSYLIRQDLAWVRSYDLLDSSVFAPMSRNPGRIAGEHPGQYVETKKLIFSR